MTPNWSDLYIGIPYLAQGRERAGLDCWGLVRLVHAEQFGVDLPSLAGAYDASDRERTAELIAARHEGWALADVPRAGDVALFRVMGQDSHVGVIVRPGYFLHVREGGAAVVERLDAIAWKHRLSGIYRYAAGASALDVVARPHPLQALRIDAQITPGMTLAQVARDVRRAGGVPEGMPVHALMSVDGVYVPREQWDTTVPPAGARVEYRATAQGSGAGRMLGMLAVMAVAMYAAPLLVGAMGGAAATATTAAIGVGGLSYGAAVGVASMGINMVGGLLLNAIFPVRPAASPAMPSTPASMAMLQGGSNSANKYGAIPVVLGRYRFTPPLGAEIYTESTESASYLRMILVWGYGPLQVSKISIGSTPMSSYDEVEIETTSGLSLVEANEPSFKAIYGADVDQLPVNIKLATADSWTERRFSGDVSKIGVVLNFPQGLWQGAVEGGNAGSQQSTTCHVEVQIRKVGETQWMAVGNVINAYSAALGEASFDIDLDGDFDALYQWTRICIDKYNVVKRHTGALSDQQHANASYALLSAMYSPNEQGQVIITGATAHLPAIPAGETVLWDVCVFGGAIIETVDHRPATLTGCAISTSGLTVTMAKGAITRASSTFAITKNTRTAFSKPINFSVEKAHYDIRVRRTDDDATDFYYSSGNKGMRAHDCYLTTITGYNNVRPVAPPKPLAMSAIRIKATNQINGNVDGIAGTVTSICLDYNSATGTWISRPTRNPASLLRYVLQHPGNAKRVADSQINLAALAQWHSFCRTNAFTFDTVLTGQQALFDVLRDIAAAGRASPTLVDGKWTVVVDRPRTEIAQHFTPHNSWGFEGLRALPVLPDAFRVNFANAARDYQADELLVYNDGFDASNARLFESISFPGVTSAAVAHKHARFHLAQLKLRPETYTLNADIEHLICTRGDLVKVTHDVPMWGLGSGRISQRISSTVVQLDEEMGMDAGKQYTLRIRQSDGASLVRTVAAVAIDGYYRQLTLTATVTAEQAEAGALVLFGELGQESVDLVVQSIEPAENMSARLTLVDYSPAIYDSDTEVISPFNSHITLPPTLLQPVVSKKPTVVRVVSDESVMKRIAPGKYIYGLRVSFTGPASLPKAVTHVQGQIDFADDDTDDWQTETLVSIKLGSITFDHVQEGSAYRFRLRYVDAAGRAGPWTAVQTHTVAGRVNPPATVTGLKATVSGARLLLDWADSKEPDVTRYEVRNVNTGWGTADAGRVYFGGSSSCYFTPGAPGDYTFYAKARDDVGNWSALAASVTFTLLAPAAPASAVQDIIKVASGKINLSIDWPAPAATSFALTGYEVRTANAGWGTAGYRYRGAASLCQLTSLSATASTTLYIKSFDALGNYSATALTVVHDVTAPASLATATLALARARATLTMTLGALPAKPADFDCYEFRIGQVRAGATGGDDAPDAVVSGTTDNFWNDSDCQIVRSATPSASIALSKFAAPLYSTAGVTYRAACRMRDKSDNYSAVSAVSAITITKIS